MKSLLSHRNVRLLVLGCGILGLILRQLLMTTGTDDKGLLVSGHPAWIALLLLSAAVAAVILLGVRSIRGSGSYRVSFPVSNPAAIGYVLAAVGAFKSWTAIDGYGIGRIAVITVTTLVILSFLLVALCRKMGRKPHLAFHLVICLYFAAQCLMLYRGQSFDPQIQNYCFQLFARIALTMTAYRLAAFDTGRGSHRRLWLWGLAAVYLCCVSMGSGLFYITGAVWAFTALSHPRRRKRQPEPTPAAEQE